jgi:hypothetical protein
MIISSSSSIELLHLGSWTELKARLLQDHLNGFLFRGHKNISWELNSSLERNFVQIKMGDLATYYVNAYRQMVETGLFDNGNHSLNEECLGTYCRHLKDESADQELPEGTKTPHEAYQRAIHLIWQMQHHEINTHFIDFTLSPYIAAYFALFYDNKPLQTDDPRKFPGIAAVNHKNLAMARLVKRIVGNRKVSPYIHERVLRQQSHLLDSFGKSHMSVVTYAIHPDWTSEVYTDLMLMNISGYKLFGTKEKAAMDFFHAYRFGNVSRGV